ncbi:uncharacterized protein B0P05DRAFT_584099 [Gilbertella persicaria]|uniref:BHLH domain-containing protein n=1 Tax=Rhizopus stolonifer TaxID=4846 RepID=A0A367IZR1_RHIST|nr:uncharacterized protein B0P05DRAFT_584099 [Gilbertella persicaria]KAI8090976.1 hypothetical protein B0P05DRAFT_584099 [Gilbertella persicaria]RCH83177.1 hypothetical protein CU098_005773 [Rhizopus stolonifer]
MEYDPAHKASSVTSTSSSSSAWDSLPSLYTGRAGSVSSVYDELEPFEEGFALYDKPQDPIIMSHDEQDTVSDFLESIFEKEKEQIILNHEVPSSSGLCHGNGKRPYQQDAQEVIKKPKLNDEIKNRELLTDDQKRANHIASEQKRRNTIRGGFKELTEIIPTLKNINNSKSTILFKSVDYIKQLDKRNKVLREKLTALKRKAQQKTHKRQALPSNTVAAALLAHKNQQKQLELLQEQLRVQQALLTKHNIQSYLYPSSLHHIHQTANAGLGYHSISIPAMDDTPVASTSNSPTLPHASLVNTTHITSHAALVMPASVDEWQHAGAASFIIPADESDKQNTFRERLLSSGKLNHLRKPSIM